MLAAKFNLKGKTNIEKVKTEGKLVQFPYFGIIVLDRNDNENSRFAFIISTKVTKQAVQRNRIKRVISETVRYELTRIINGYDCIFLVKKTSVRTNSDILIDETKKALMKVGIAK